MNKETKIILIEFGSSQPVRAEVPLDATVTFGGLIPGAKSDGGANRTALRIYKGKNQIAVFTGVTNFRMIEQVAVLEKRVQTAQKSVAVEENGVVKQRNVSVSTEDWVDPDEVKTTSSDADAVRAQLRLETN